MSSFAQGGASLLVSMHLYPIFFEWQDRHSKTAPVFRRSLSCHFLERSAEQSGSDQVQVMLMLAVPAEASDAALTPTSKKHVLCEKLMLNQPHRLACSQRISQHQRSRAYSNHRPKRISICAA